ncbi:LLM class flavin-dependent oxidoreductase [Phototrophicus methaneseepsis]|uniref:LLM class flavin-dependent oxidoreductase n=1 Tax=Phototrophicus methaneseepsis TaxID=2710758 RepID=A0A7S8IG37_9CHLR|nr:LLM class flavin-dependent oxidoreductase [Phototrophicus methaneseepsis]QPC84252.1 LLM class flavin-dependent oxidoreductase [Phototrophicus methaneseepsis]
MSKIKFGWRSPAFSFDGTRGTDFLEQITTTMDLVHGSFDSVWVADHFIPWASFAAPDTDTLEAWTTISYLAGAYPNIDFGSIVLSQSYRNPALLAKSAATLQWLTGGRFILGIGAGWKEDEYLAYGYDFPKASVRIKQLSEAVHIIRKMWTESPATFEGDYYQIKDAYCEPMPDPAPPIMIGGGGEQLTLRVVAEQADWWNLSGSADFYGHKLDVLRGHCEAVGRDYESIVKTWTSDTILLAPSEAEAQRIAAANPLMDGVSGYTPQHLMDQLQSLIDLGVSYFMLRFADFPHTEGIQMFMEEVMPVLREKN